MDSKKIKALSVKEPWASLIAQGEKTIEIRSWKTKYRGKILICCCKKPKSTNSGNAICVVDLVEIRDLDKADLKKAFVKGIDVRNLNAWVLKNPIKIKPFEVKGKLGLFNVTIN